MTILIFGGVWFWSLLILASILLLWALEMDSSIFATVIFLITGALTLCLGNWSWVEWLIANPLYFIGGIVNYLIIGIVWSIVKWWLLVENVALEHLEARVKWLTNCRDAFTTEMDKIPYNNALKIGILSTELKKKWDSYRRKAYFDNITRPLAANNKDKIMGWMAYWPWSALWTIINDPIRRFFNWLYELLSKTYQRISDSAFKGLE